MIYQRFGLSINFSVVIYFVIAIIYLKSEFQESSLKREGEFLCKYSAHFIALNQWIFKIVIGNEILSILYKSFDLESLLGMEHNEEILAWARHKAQPGNPWCYQG